MFINISVPLQMERLNQIYLVLIDRKWHSSILDVGFFIRSDCGTYHHLVLASEQAAPTFDVKLLNLMELSDLYVRKQHQIKV